MNGARRCCHRPYVRALGRLLLLAGALAMSAGPASALLQTRRVVFFIVDGPRGSEFLEDPSHQYIPQIWSELRPQAYVLHAFYNLGDTSTVPGHATILTGTMQYLPNDGSVRPTMPTIWEYARAATGGSDAMCVFTTYKSKLLCLTYSTHLQYGAPDSARVIGPTWIDEVAVNEWYAQATANQPMVSAMFLGRTDSMAHNCDWYQYTEAIRGVDTLAVDVWNWIESTPGWAGRTTMIITSDHGRHLDDWCNHGDGCLGCRQIPLIALGPDFLQGVETSVPWAEQRDLCATAALLLGIPAPYTEGRVLWEMFASPEDVPSPAGGPLRLHASPVPATGDILARLPGARSGTWRASLFDPAGRCVWSRSCAGSDLERGIIVPPPLGTGSGVAWLHVHHAEGATAGARLAWVR